MLLCLHGLPHHLPPLAVIRGEAACHQERRANALSAVLRAMRRRRWLPSRVDGRHRKGRRDGDCAPGHRIREEAVSAANLQHRFR